MSVSFTGFKKQLTETCTISEGKPDQDIGLIILLPSDHILNEVTVTAATKKLLDVRPGKITMNIENSILAAGNTAYELLKRSPGVQIDNSDMIKLNGRQGVLIMINGRQIFMDNDALIELLQNTQSNDVELIELMSNPSAKYEAQGSGAIINIKLKKNKNFGTNGSVSGAFGISDLGRAYDFNKRYNGGLSLNYRSKSINLFGSDNYANTTFLKSSLNNRDINAINQPINVDVDYLGKQLRESHTYKAGADFSIDPKNIIGVLVSGSLSNVTLDKNNKSVFSSQGKKDSSILTNSNQSRRFSNIGFNMNYKGTSGKKNAELSIDLDYLDYDRESLEYLTNDFLDAFNNPYQPFLIYRNNSPSEFKARSFKIDYSLPFTKTQKVEMGVQGSKVTGDNKLYFDEVAGSTLKSDTRFTNRFKIDQQITGGYISYKTGFKKLDVQAGLRVEHTYSVENSITYSKTTKQNYIDFFPSLQYNYNLNENNQFSVSYGRRILRPQYDDLNPSIAYLDKYTFRSGNPSLSPEYTHNIEFSHVYKDKFTTTLRATLINDVILGVFEQDDDTKVNTYIKRNIDRQFSYGLDFNAPVDITSWWNSSISFGAFYQRFTDKSLGGNLDNASPAILISATQSFSFKYDFNAELFSRYESPAKYGISDFKALYSIDAGMNNTKLKYFIV